MIVFLRYKFSVTLDEYSVPERFSLTMKEIDFNKNTIDYESEWIEISNEQVTPFYREKQQYKQNCLFLNKCWIDLKLFPLQRNQAKFKLIYLVLQSDEFFSPNDSMSNNNVDKTPTEKLNSAESSSLTRILTIQTKFFINNKTNLDLKLQIEDDFLKKGENKQLKRFIESATDDEDHLIKASSIHSTGNVINKRHFCIKSDVDNSPSHLINVEDSTHDDLIDRENINDLFYLKIVSVQNRPVKQSKPAVLTVKEKAIKQISSNGQIDDNLLISRQCFSLYSASFESSKPVVLAQKLLVNKNGQLVVVIREDANYLVNFHNCLDVDIYVWPRLSTNFIFENYVKNVHTLNEKLLVDFKARGNFFFRICFSYF